MGKFNSFEEINSWQKARQFNKRVYEITDNQNFKRDFDLVRQIRRASISISSNIAEGCGRQTAKDTINFLHISRGSLYELETQCYVALDQKYIDENNFNIVFNQMQSCKKLLNGFINYYRKLL